MFSIYTTYINTLFKSIFLDKKVIYSCLRYQIEHHNQKIQNANKLNEVEDNENANNQKVSSGGDAYTKMVTKVEKIKVGFKRNIHPKFPFRLLNFRGLSSENNLTNCFRLRTKIMEIFHNLTRLRIKAPSMKMTAMQM